ncbi:DeoR family transcriptional regulator [Cricetibacter osteomyelitidis]|uniref:DeoR family transcriptional regulator n=1 Tax=Cricetibacter osteomyelitidis TaxID=1521931 RepID=A0A4R2SZN3_9PAST|nr:DeoR/GlpR family DNA-binding transcription regulator [Cricetibacter osteomyelitidis]TCP90118.1 DeoR family transcriptional regulator [Cricetibacter osteomyelitidis]
MPTERAEKIILFLKSHAIATVEQLVKVTGSSPATIRRDLVKMSDEGTILRTHGGVSLNQFIAYQPTTNEKAARQIAEKERITDYAASLITAGSSVLLDAGTTTLMIARKIAHIPLRVITTDLHIALFLSEYKQIEVTITGGRIDHSSQSCIGAFGQNVLERVYPDFAFVSCNSWDLNAGVTAPTEEKAHLKKTLSGAAKQRFLVADSSKYGKYSLYAVAPLNHFSAIVTDNVLLPEAQVELKANGIQLELV